MGKVVRFFCLGLLLIATWGCKLSSVPTPPNPGGKLPPDDAGGGDKKVGVVALSPDFSAFFQEGRTMAETKNVFPNVTSFAALKADGSVVTWGSKYGGGEIPNVALPLLKSDVVKIYSNNYAFAALKKDGSIVNWGSSSNGGQRDDTIKSLRGFSKIYSTYLAFAATKSDGSYLTVWGEDTSGGDLKTIDQRVSAHISTGAAKVKLITSTMYSFSALMDDTADRKQVMISWGTSQYGMGAYEKVKPLLEDGKVEKLFAGGYDFAALKTDGSVITWPLDTSNNSALKAPAAGGAKISQIFTALYGFAGLKTNGAVVTWGALDDGAGAGYLAPPSASLDSNVATIASTPYAFAALKKNGSVVTWGDKDFGADSSSVASKISSGVRELHSTQAAFAAIKNDNSVVYWGKLNDGKDAGPIDPPANGLTNVYSLSANRHAFAALKNDGSVVSWGDPCCGGDDSLVRNQLSTDVVRIFSNGVAFVALKKDGTLVTWGDSANGGNSQGIVWK